MRGTARAFGGAARVAGAFIGMALFLTCFCGGCALKEQARLNMPVTYPEKTQARNAFWPAPSLEATFEQYWAARLSGDWETAFGMEAPYFQEIVPRPLYSNYVKNAINNEWLGMELLNLERNPEYFVALTMRLTYKSRRGRDGTVTLKDRWVEVNGRWYHVLRDRFIFPSVSESG
jgi:hypothetical protein